MCSSDLSSEFFAWMLDGVPADEVAAVLAELPLPLRLVYRAAWRPRYARVARW